MKIFLFINLCFSTTFLTSVLTAKPSNSDCLCTYEEDPVCDTNGKNYINRCYLDCLKSLDPSIEFKHPGLCS
ncbi:unnamed protein product [Diabrotica balteata]|uniref:Kazal-like domain-containing protein n=1 Tax=Diabrotica balteata TaxID=107213 RepID=A0A9N9SPH0_DIABA|nr:unnamed protein product [Diabrotica balteata]